MSYNFQRSIVFIVVTFLVLIFSYFLQYAVRWSYSLTASCLDCFGFIVLLGWANPDLVVAWAGNGIDMHPENKNLVILSKESKNYPLWQQPNRCKFIAAAAFLFSTLFLYALDQIIERYGF
ncbi:MAG: hypothetical protein JWO53_808 [Chlamydiia bacterium]|nr:hypothetical protein [Chlamydiia bacterium]